MLRCDAPELHVVRSTCAPTGRHVVREGICRGREWAPVASERQALSRLTFQFAEGALLLRKRDVALLLWKRERPCTFGRPPLLSGAPLFARVIHECEGNASGVV